VSRRVGVVCDLAGEAWPSMDLVAEQLLRHLQSPGGGFTPVALRAPTTWRLARVPLVGSYQRVRMLDRLINRYRDYPRWLARHQDGLDVFHIIDHSYAHLVAQLPAAATIVTCHDLDAFRPVLHAAEEPRPRWLRALIGRTLAGLRQAARVACVSRAVGDEIVAAGLVDPSRVRVVPNGIDAVMTPRPDVEADGAAERLLGPARSSDLVHVGSAAPRKRVDVLLRAFALVRERRPDARLVRVGGLTAGQRALAGSLGVGDAVVELPFLDRNVLAAIYRRASVVVVASDREGFGLPVAEALACGVPVVASDIPSLRETGGEAAVYCPRGDAAAFARAALALMDPASGDRRTTGLNHAAGFTWQAHAAHMEALYREVA
jgi:glycosyltransferase involved in cell wall biosynthesis